LQEKGLEAVVKTVGVARSHMAYFSNKDVAGFVLSKLHDEKTGVNTK
jgi:hypothetical protein